MQYIEHVAVEFSEPDNHTKHTMTLWMFHGVVMIVLICAQHLSKFCWPSIITILYKEWTVIHDVNLLSIWCQEYNPIFIPDNINKLRPNQIFTLDENEKSNNIIIYIRGNIRSNILTVIFVIILV